MVKLITFALLPPVMAVIGVVIAVVLETRNYFWLAVTLHGDEAEGGPFVHVDKTVSQHAMLQYDELPQPKVIAGNA